MRDLKQSSTAQPLVFLMVLSSDHITGATGLSPTVTLSKNGASFGAASGSITEIGNGWYKVAGNATDTDTLGPLLLHATAGTADPCDVQHEVVAYDPQDSVRLGLTALPNAAANANGGLPILSSSGTTLAYTVTTVTTTTTATNLTNLPSITAGWLTAAGIADDAITAAKIANAAIDTATFASGATIPRVTLADTVTTVTGLTAANLDVAVSSRMATYTQPTGFLAATFPATVSSYAGGAVASVTGSVGSVVGLTAANLDVAVSTRASATNLATAHAALVKIQASVFDSLSISGSTLTLSNGAVMVVSDTARTTTP